MRQETKSCEMLRAEFMNMFVSSELPQQWTEEATAAAAATERRLGLGDARGVCVPPGPAAALPRVTTRGALTLLLISTCLGTRIVSRTTLWLPDCIWIIGLAFHPSGRHLDLNHVHSSCSK